MAALFQNPLYRPDPVIYVRLHFIQADLSSRSKLCPATNIYWTTTLAVSQVEAPAAGYRNDVKGRKASPVARLENGITSST